MTMSEKKSMLVSDKEKRLIERLRKLIFGRVIAFKEDNKFTRIETRESEKL